MNNFGLLGSHISYSLSPFIHNKLFELRGVQAKYDVYDATGVLQNALDEIKVQSVCGFNVTIPYKESIYACIPSENLDPSALYCKSVNTVIVKDEQWYGYNTDGLGLVKGLEYRGVSVEGKTAIVIGAGGAAKGIVQALLYSNITKVYIHNRNFERAYELALLFNRDKVRAIKTYKDLEVDILIQTTPVGSKSFPNELSVNLDELLCQTVVDIIYKPWLTPLLEVAKTRGLNYYNGLDMLFFQAVKAQEIWFGTCIDSNLLYDALKEVEYYASLHQ